MTEKIRTLLLTALLIFTGCMIISCGDRKEAENIKTETEQKEEKEDKKAEEDKTSENTDNKTEETEERRQEQAAVPAKQEPVIQKEIPEEKQEENPAETVGTEDAEENGEEMRYAIGYVLSSDGSSIQIDEENTEGRTYPDEGKDRAITYDISQAADYSPGGARAGLTVELTYYEKDGVRYAVEINSDGDEKEPRMDNSDISFWNEEGE